MLQTLCATFAAVSVAALAVACGDGPDVAPTPAPTIAVTATPTVPAAQTIPAPVVPEGNIEAIHPAHGQKVTQASTRSPRKDDPRGACVQVNFDGPAENAQWIRVVFDEEEVTDRLTVILPVDAETVQPEGGTFCWAPDEGYTVGTHTMTVAVQDPNNMQGPTYHFVQWQFEVTP